MTDEKISRRKAVMKSVITCVVLLAVCLASIGFVMFTQVDVDEWELAKEKEHSLQMQLDSVAAQNSQLSATIEETGKKLVSFSDDKLTYIDKASTLSITHEVQINKLTVSDVWSEGQMSGMTVTIEVQGNTKDVQDFVLEYCSSQSANRVNSISYRPADKYVWVQRSVDDSRVLSWFDLQEEEAQYAVNQQKQQQKSAVVKMEGDLATADDGDTVDESDEISIETMFADRPVKAYLVVDFLGRA